MRIVMDAVPPQGTTISADLGTAWAARAAEAALDVAPTALDVRLRVRHVDGCARVDGQMAVSFEQPCARCGGPVRVRLSGDSDLLFAKMAAPGAEDVNLDAADLDVSWFDGHALDLSQAVSEQLALWLPPRVRCGEDGVERMEEGTCEVPQHDGGPALERHNPFAVLRKKQ